MRSIMCSAAGVLAVACAGADTPAVPDSATTMTAVAATPPPAPSGADVAWFATADSVMRVHLQRSLYRSPEGYASRMRECASDEGGDNPTFAVAAARARILGHDSIDTYTVAEYGLPEGPLKQTTYTVELTSAALFTPNWIAELPYTDSTIYGDEAYVVDVGPRVDTVRIILEDLGNNDPRWGVCAPTHPPGMPGKGYWSFLRSGRRWPKPILWKPPTGSWERIRAIADSLSP